MSERQLSLKDWLEIASLGPSAIRAAEAAFSFEQALNEITNTHSVSEKLLLLSEDGIRRMADEQESVEDER